MSKGNANVLGVSIGKELIDRLKKQAIRETTKHQRPVTVTEIVRAAVEEYLAEWETGIETAQFFDEHGNPEVPPIQEDVDDLAKPGERMPDGSHGEGNLTM